MNFKITAFTLRTGNKNKNTVLPSPAATKNFNADTELISYNNNIPGDKTPTEHSNRMPPVEELDIANGVLFKGMIPYSKELDKSQDGRQNKYLDYIVPSYNAPTFIDEDEDSNESDNTSKIPNGMNGDVVKQVHSNQNSLDIRHDNNIAVDKTIKSQETLKEISSTKSKKSRPSNKFECSEELDYEYDSESDSMSIDHQEALFSSEESLDNKSEYEDDIPNNKQGSFRELSEERDCEYDIEKDPTIIGDLSSDISDNNTQENAPYYEEEILNTKHNDDRESIGVRDSDPEVDFLEGKINEKNIEWNEENCFQYVPLSLRDIGYIPPLISEDIDENTTFKKNSVVSPKDVHNFEFKTPLPPKPYPSSNMAQYLPKVYDEPSSELDDAISLYASTISGLSDDEDCDSPSKLHQEQNQPSSSKGLAVFQQNSDANVQTRVFNFSPPQCHENLQTVSCKSELGIENNASERSRVKIPNSPKKLPSNVPSFMEVGNGNLQNSSKQVVDLTLSDRRPDHTTIPNVFRGLCFSHFLHGSCNRRLCKHSHKFTSEQFNKKYQNKTDINRVVADYKFSTQHPVLFEGCYKIFVDTFVSLDMDEQLVNCILDVINLRNSKINCPAAIKYIVAACCNVGISLKTVEKIQHNLDFNKYPVLVEALMDICSQQAISKSWCVIRKLLHIRNFISPEHFTRILHQFNSDTSGNEILWRNIYTEVIKKNLTDLSKVPSRLLDALKTRLYPQERVSDNNIHLFTNGGPFGPTLRSRSDESVVENYVPEYKRSRSDETVTGNNGYDTDSCCDVFPPMKSNATSRSKREYLVKPLTSNNNGSRQKSFFDQINAAPVIIFPEYPIVGEFKNTKNSLKPYPSYPHPLLPIIQTQGQKYNINVCDCISSLNVAVFLQYVEDQMVASTRGSFFLQCINEFGKDSSSFLKMVEKIKHIQSYNNHIVKGALEVIAFNLIVLHAGRNEHDSARKIIEKFLDWDSLLTSQMYIKHRPLSHMGKYIYLASILEKSNSFFHCFTILSSLGLKLMRTPKDWPVMNSSEVDLQKRNALITTFLSRAERYAKPELCALYKHMFSAPVSNFDARSSFNTLLESIFKQKNWAFLGHFSIGMEDFFLNMDTDKLRAFIIILVQRTEEILKRLEYFEYGCRAHIYNTISGQEPVLRVEMSMPDTELKLLLEKYFYQMRSSWSRRSTGLRIEITIPFVSEGELKYLELIDRTNWSLSDARNSVRALLTDYFRFEDSEVISSDPNRIDISAESLNWWVTGH